MSKINKSQAELDAQEALARISATPAVTPTTPKGKKEKAPRKVTRADKIKSGKTKKAVVKKDPDPVEVTESTPAIEDAVVEETPAVEEVAEETPAIEETTVVEEVGEETPAPVEPAAAVLVPTQPELDAIQAAQVAKWRSAKMASQWGQSYYTCKLGNMRAAFLILLDDAGDILRFVAGAVRFRQTREEDRVLASSTLALWEGMTGQYRDAEGRLNQGDKAYSPAPTSYSLVGNQRRLWSVDTWKEDRAAWSDEEVLSAGPRRGIMREIPMLTDMLLAETPEAAADPNRRWGVLIAQVDATKTTVGGRLTGSSQEYYLRRNWLEDRDQTISGRAGGVVRTIRDRLAPRALHYANNSASCWTLATAAISLYGGLRNDFTDKEVAGTTASKAVAEMLMLEHRQQHYRPSRSDYAQLPLGSNLGDVMSAATHRASQGA